MLDQQLALYNLQQLENGAGRREATRVLQTVAAPWWRVLPATCMPGLRCSIAELYHLQRSHAAVVSDLPDGAAHTLDEAGAAQAVHAGTQAMSPGRAPCQAHLQGRARAGRRAARHCPRSVCQLLSRGAALMPCKLQEEADTLSQFLHSRPCNKVFHRQRPGCLQAIQGGPA